METSEGSPLPVGYKNCWLGHVRFTSMEVRVHLDTY